MSGRLLQTDPFVFLRRAVLIALLLEIIKLAVLLSFNRFGLMAPYDLQNPIYGISFVLFIPEQLVSGDGAHHPLTWVGMFTAGTIFNLVPALAISWLWSLAKLNRSSA